MNDDQVLRDVHEWLRDQGYALEMEVAQALMPHCRYVVQGYRYADPISGKMRETDILASWSPRKQMTEGTSHAVTMVVECKSSTAPWIAFTAGSTNYEGIFPYLGEGNCIQCDEVIEAMASLADDDMYAYSLTEKRSNKNHKDHAYEAISAVASAAVAEARASEQYLKAHPVHYKCEVLPLVVTGGPLISCQLDNDGNTVLTRLERCWVSGANDAWPTPIHILIATRASIKKLISHLSESWKQIGLG